jgi:hypothetical protein
MVRLQVLTVRVNEKIPGLVFDKNGGAIVQQVPTNEIQILLGARSFNRHCEIPTTFRRTVRTKYFARWYIFPLGFAAINGLGWQ